MILTSCFTYQNIIKENKLCVIESIEALVTTGSWVMGNWVFARCLKTGKDCYWSTSTSLTTELVLINRQRQQCCCHLKVNDFIMTELRIEETRFQHIETSWQYSNALLPTDVDWLISMYGFANWRPYRADEYFVTTGKHQCRHFPLVCPKIHRCHYT